MAEFPILGIVYLAIPIFLLVLTLKIAFRQCKAQGAHDLPQKDSPILSEPPETVLQQQSYQIKPQALHSENSRCPHALKHEMLYIRKQTRIIERKDGDGKNLSRRHEARIVPNQRLKLAFGLDNIFTTQKEVDGYKFKQQAISVMKEAMNLSNTEKREDWSELVKHMRSTLQKEDSRIEGSINLASLVQYVTLSISLKYLFNISDATLADNVTGVKFIAKRINELWVLSKQQPAPKWEDEMEMHYHLLVVTGRDSLNSFDNPMNLILPAYDTMWRAVFRGILEIYFRDQSGHNPILWQSILATYLSDQRQRNWKWDDDVFQLSCLDIIKEVLRLYPPTRRIYRQYPGQNKISADIEHMQRTFTLAGDDPESFRPHRWVQLKEILGPGKLKDVEESMGFMPFALVCPAGGRETKGFGWKMIALLIAVFMEKLRELEGNWRLRSEKEDDNIPELGKAMRSGRDDYLSLVYEKTESVLEADE
ncbi:uncharacterized protein L3040_004625 [Drepanopeziza brunnea f. sp. 'multigermtubi']|uniref:Cytochrome P450 n=1 Tax=Marssonina brunnea f. sp. multigermtubi (strain MB_m1) TaxID=1072389 RepID=K1X7C1_MARBU|nr:uncharacterized protein MBM_00120 [Drepanopeziza brunnea f. sp. 'multigermtubi' MB_m1]EKD21007.1 hypothetical protein MBM_00120 [Drepanopeziza brunnea f. sp. 'multigermtubi' MB_m1]KAJ5042067.1 hypothetical protein L3040_004625 [Drepanopeziza brunnea f. sp. 'multigermtubi']